MRECRKLLSCHLCFTKVRTRKNKFSPRKTCFTIFFKDTRIWKLKFLAKKYKYFCQPKGFDRTSSEGIEPPSSGPKPDILSIKLRALGYILEVDLIL